MNDFTNVKRKIEAIPNCCPKRQEKKIVKEDLDGDTTDSYQKVTDAVFRTKKERWKKFDVSGFRRCVLKYHKKSPAAFWGRDMSRVLLKLLTSSPSLWSHQDWTIFWG